MKPFSEWSLRARLGLLLTLLTAASAIAPAWIFFVRLEQELLRRSQPHLNGLIDQQASELERFAELLRADLALLAATPALAKMAHATQEERDPSEELGTELLRQHLEDFFTGLLRTRLVYDQIRLIDLCSDGKERVRVDRDPKSGAIRRVAGDELQFKRDRPYVQAALKASHRSFYLSMIELNREHGQVTTPYLPVLRAARLIPNASGEPCDLLVINMAFERLLRRVASYQAEPHDYFIVNSLGDFVAHPDKARTYRFEFGEDSGALEELPVLQAVLREGRERGWAEGPLHDGVKTVASAVRARLDPGDPEKDVVIVVRATTRDLTALSRETAAQAGALAAILVVIGLALAAALAAWIHSPLSRLANSMATLDIDDPDAHISVPRSPEAREVALAFNRVFSRLRQATDESKRTSMELEQFAYAAAHDLKEPARSIHSFAGLLQARYLSQFDERGQKALHFVASSSARMLQLIDHLLSHSRLGTVGEVEDVPLIDLVHQVLDDLAVALETSAGSVQVGELPVVLGRAVDLRTLFQNLIANALKFRKPDVAPKVVIEAQVRSDRRVEICVRDNGIGIPRTQRENVFDLFRRAHSEADYPGCGIGLASCRKIVEQHGGTIWIDDAREGGTAVWFSLPGPSSSAM